MLAVAPNEPRAPSDRPHPPSPTSLLPSRARGPWWQGSSLASRGSVKNAASPDSARVAAIDDSCFSLQARVCLRGAPCRDRPRPGRLPSGAGRPGSSARRPQRTAEHRCRDDGRPGALSGRPPVHAEGHQAAPRSGHELRERLPDHSAVLSLAGHAAHRPVRAQQRRAQEHLSLAAQEAERAPRLVAPSRIRDGSRREVPQSLPPRFRADQGGAGLGPVVHAAGHEPKCVLRLGPVQERKEDPLRPREQRLRAAGLRALRRAPGSPLCAPPQATLSGGRRDRAPSRPRGQGYGLREQRGARSPRRG